MYYDGFQFCCKNYSKELASTLHTYWAGHTIVSWVMDFSEKKQLQKTQIKSGRASGIAVLQIIHECARIIVIVNTLGHIAIFG